MPIPSRLLATLSLALACALAPQDAGALNLFHIEISGNHGIAVAEAADSSPFTLSFADSFGSMTGGVRPAATAQAREHPNHTAIFVRSTMTLEFMLTAPAGVSETLADVIGFHMVSILGEGAATTLGQIRRASAPCCPLVEFPEFTINTFPGTGNAPPGVLMSDHWTLQDILFPTNQVLEMFVRVTAQARTQGTQAFLDPVFTLEPGITLDTLGGWPVNPDFIGVPEPGAGLLLASAGLALALRRRGRR